eukprot:scaffold223708_cov18-Tisochrysis_lutea.AAC.1
MPSREVQGLLADFQFPPPYIILSPVISSGPNFPADKESRGLTQAWRMHPWSLHARWKAFGGVEGTNILVGYLGGVKGTRLTRVHLWFMRVEMRVDERTSTFGEGLCPDKNPHAEPQHAFDKPAANAQLRGFALGKKGVPVFQADTSNPEEASLRDQ